MYTSETVAYHNNETLGSACPLYWSSWGFTDSPRPGNHGRKNAWLPPANNSWSVIDQNQAQQFEPGVHVVESTWCRGYPPHPLRQRWKTANTPLGLSRQGQQNTKLLGSICTDTTKDGGIPKWPEPFDLLLGKRKLIADYTAEIVLTQKALFRATNILYEIFRWKKKSNWCGQLISSRIRRYIGIKINMIYDIFRQCWK